MYVCINYPMFVAPQFPKFMYTMKCSVYPGIIDVVLVHGCHLSWHPNRATHCLPWRLLTKTGVGKCADTWYKWIEPTETVELCWLQQHACVKLINGSVRNNRWYCCFVMFIIDMHTPVGATFNLLQCLHVNRWMLSCTMWRHYWHCWLILSYCHNNNQLRLALSIPRVH